MLCSHCALARSQLRIGLCEAFEIGLVALLAFLAAILTSLRETQSVLKMRGSKIPTYSTLGAVVGGRRGKADRLAGRRRRIGRNALTDARWNTGAVTNAAPVRLLLLTAGVARTGSADVVARAWWRC